MFLNYLSTFWGAVQNQHIYLLEQEIIRKTEDGFKAYPFVVEVVANKYRVDFFDVVKAIVDIDIIINEETKNGNEIAVDISSGNKIISIALFIAAQINKLPVTYCKAGGYAPLKRDKNKRIKEKARPDEIAFSVKGKVDIPLLPLVIKKLPYDILESLSEIKYSSSISDLIRKMGKEDTKSEILSTSRKIEELEKYGYVIVNRAGVKKELRITDEGMMAASLRKSPSINK